MNDMKRDLVRIQELVGTAFNATGSKNIAWLPPEVMADR